MRLFYFLFLLLAIQYEAYSAINIEHAQLDNGMVVYVIENHHTPIVSHMVLYCVGGINDPRSQSGLAHFLEHLMFRGTQDIKDISAVIQKEGGVFNATTSSYYTNYFETVLKDKLELMMQLEADRMRNLQITENSVIAERKIVTEERRMRIDNNPSAQLEEEMLSAFYHNNAAWQVAGWPNEIATLNKEKADYLYTNFYHPNNAVLLIVGDTTMQKVIPLAEKHYGVIPASDKILKSQLLYEPKHKADVTITLRDEKVKQEEVNIWYKAPNISNANSLPLKLASIILGSGRTSYLYKEFVLGQIVTHINTGYDLFTKGEAIFEISALTSNNPSEVTAKIVELINKVSAKGIAGDDLKRAKNMLRASLIYNAESPSVQAVFYGNMIMAGTGYDSIKSLEEMIEKITVDQVNEALKDTLHKKNKVVGYLMPMEYRNEK